MKLPSRIRYGFRAILQLAMDYGKGRLQLKIIAKRVGGYLRRKEKALSCVSNISWFMPFSI